MKEKLRDIFLSISEGKKLILKNKWLILLPTLLFIIDFFISIIFKFTLFSELLSKYSCYAKFSDVISELRCNIYYEFATPLKDSIFMIINQLPVSIKAILLNIDKLFIGTINNINEAYNIYGDIFRNLLTKSILMLFLNFNSNIKYLGPFLDAISLITTIPSLLMVVIFPLIQGSVLIWIKHCFNNERINFRDVIKKSLKVFMPLFIFDIIIGLLSGTGALFEMYLTEFTNLDLVADPSIIACVANVKNSSYYISLLLIALTVVLPFIIVCEEKGFRKSCKRNFYFIKADFVKYLSLLIISMLLLFVPIFIAGIIPNIYLGIIWEVLIIYISLVITIAFFDLYLKYKSREADAGISS